MDDELKALLQQAQQQKKKRQRTRPPSSSTTPLQRPPTLTLADLAASTQPPTATTRPFPPSSSTRTPSTLNDLVAARTEATNTTTTMATATTTSTTRLIPFQLRTVKLSSDHIESLLQNRALKKLSSLIFFLDGETAASLPDFALVGVLGKKGPRKQSRNGKDYAEWLLDDLEGHSAKIFVFGGALKGGQNLPIGTVCLLLQPKPLDSRPGQSAAPSLAVYEPSQVVQVGISANFATCGFTDGRGFQCDQVYNRLKARFCSQHSRPGSGSTGMSKVKAGSAPTFTALTLGAAAMLPTPGRRGQGGTRLIVRPNLIGNRPTPVPKKQAGAAAGSGKKKELLEKMIKQDQPHRAYRWQPTLVNNSKKPDAGGAATSGADTASSSTRSSSCGGGGAGGGTSGASRSVIAPVKMEGDRVRWVQVTKLLGIDHIFPHPSFPLPRNKMTISFPLLRALSSPLSFLSLPCTRSGKLRPSWPPMSPREMGRCWCRGLRASLSGAGTQWPTRRSSTSRRQHVWHEKRLPCTAANCSRSRARPRLCRPSRSARAWVARFGWPPSRPFLSPPSVCQVRPPCRQVVARSSSTRVG